VLSWLGVLICISQVSGCTRMEVPYLSIRFVHLYCNFYRCFPQELQN
jgi:hypothetical protein